MTTYWGLSLDDLAEFIYTEMDSDATGAHYLAFVGDRPTARRRMIEAFTELIDKHLYLANSYGGRWHEEDEEC